MAYFDGIKVGDRVYDIRCGWGTVSRIRDHKCGLWVVFDTRDDFDMFTMDGAYFKGQGQTLFWSKPEFTPPPRPKRKVTKTIERFINVYPNDKITCTFNTLHDANEYDVVCGGCRRIACVKLTGTYEVEE